MRRDQTQIDRSHYSGSRRISSSCRFRTLLLEPVSKLVVPSETLPAQATNGGPLRHFPTSFVPATVYKRDRKPLLVNRTREITRCRAREVEDLRERLGRLNHVELRQLREAQGRLMMGAGSERDARLVENLGFTNLYTRSFFRDRIPGDDPLLRSLSPLIRSRA